MKDKNNKSLSEHNICEHDIVISKERGFEIHQCKKCNRVWVYGI